MSGKFSDLDIENQEEDPQIRTDEEASEAAEAAYEAANKRGEICPGCDGPKKKEHSHCIACEQERKSI